MSEYNEVVNALKSLWSNTQSEIVYLSPNYGYLRMMNTAEIRSIIEGMASKKHIGVLTYPLIDPITRDHTNNDNFLCYKIQLYPYLVHSFRGAAGNDSAAIKTETKQEQIRAVLRLSFDQRGVVLNDIFTLKKPHGGSENEKVLEFLLRQPNTTHTKGAVEAAINTKLKKELYDIVRGLGLENDLMAAFFPRLTKDEIRFINPVASHNLEIMGISSIPIMAVKSSKSVNKNVQIEEPKSSTKINLSKSEEMTSN